MGVRVVQCDTGIDAALIAQLVKLLGAERLGELIDILDDRLYRIMIRLNERSVTGDLLDAIHQSIGSTSSLGFVRLAGLLGLLETLMREAAPEGGGSTGIQVKRLARISRELEKVRIELRQARSSALLIMKPIERTALKAR